MAEKAEPKKYVLTDKMEHRRNPGDRPARADPARSGIAALGV